MSKQDHDEDDDPCWAIGPRRDTNEHEMVVAITLHCAPRRAAEQFCEMLISFTQSPVAMLELPDCQHAWEGEMPDGAFASATIFHPPKPFKRRRNAAEQTH